MQASSFRLISDRRLASLRAMLVLMCATLTIFSAHAADATLDVTLGQKTQHLTRTELLKLPTVRTVVVINDVSYKKTMTYRAIPLKALVHDLNNIETVQFKAEDGFVANIPSSVLTGASQPWIAIEPANSPWPALKEGGRSAGPFYLVWLSPERSHIGPEQWPYQIAAINATSSLEERFPHIVPDASLPPDSPEHRGLKMYSTHCASCHQINGGGDANIGPDLNRPHNPTEYFEPSFLRQYIRNPALVRSWPQMTMPGFPQAALSDAQLDDLLAYLRYMAKKK